MNKEQTEYLLNKLLQMRDGIFEDHSAIKIAFHLGILLSFVELSLKKIKDEEKKEKDFGHT